MSLIGDIRIDPSDLEAARAGDPAARERLYGLVAGPVHALIRRLVGRESADDLFQDTLLRMYERLGDYRGDAPIGRWVRSIAVNACLMHLRSPWRRARGWLGGGPGTGDDAAAGDPFDTLPARSPGVDAAVAADLARLLDRLSPPARAVLWLYEVEGCSHEEIARAHGRSVSYSKSRLARAHAQLRALVAQPSRTAASPAIASGEEPT